MDLLIYVGKSAGILSIFYLVYYFVLRKDTFFTANRHFLFSGIITALALPFLQFTQIRYIEATPYVLTEPLAQPFIGGQLYQNLTPSFSIDWWQVLLVIYTVGCFIMGVHLLVQLFSLLKLLRKYPSQQIGVYKFVEVDELITPFSFFKHIVYNPRLHSEKEISMILAHEKVHARQWHSIDILLSNMVRIIQWINPVSWLYKKSLEENLEFIADDHTVQIISSKKEYQLALVKASSTLYAPALTVQFYQSFIKKRIIMLNKSNSNKYNQLKLSLILPFLALFLWSFNVTEIVEYTAPETILVSEIATPESSDETPEKATLAAELTIKDNSAKEEEKASNPSKEEATAENKSRKPIKTNASALIAKAQPASTIPTNLKMAFRTNAIVKDYRFTITSKTTDAELSQFKAEMKKEHGLHMNYSVDRNNSGEITSLSISYSSKGKNGSFNINDDKPIEDFYFYIQENGDTGFYSESQTKLHRERMLKRTKKMEERHEEMKERLEELHEVREIEMEKRQEEMEERHVEMEERRNEMRRRLKEQKEIMIEREHKDHEDHEEVIHLNRHNNEVRTIQKESDSHESHSIILDSDTTDATLAEMKTNLKAKGVSFSYSKLKRNSAGKITRIRVDVDNGKGSKQSIYSKTDDGEPIDEIIIEF